MRVSTPRIIHNIIRPVYRVNEFLCHAHVHDYYYHVIQYLVDYTHMNMVESIEFYNMYVAVYTMYTIEYSK